MAKSKPKWLRGKYRWWALATIIVGYVLLHFFPPIQPHVQLPAEKLGEHPLFVLPGVGPIYLTNTLVALILVDLLLLWVVWAVQKAVRSGDLVPKGLSGAVEAGLEYIYNLTESTAGKWAGFIFPFFATITLMVLLANWMEVFPFVDSVGFVEKVAEGGHGFPIREVGPFAILVREHAAHGEYALVPWIRVVSTDLNFTLALALISVFMTQVLGFKALGLSYLSKFFRFSGMVQPFKEYFSAKEGRSIKGLIGGFFMGFIDFFVGILEIISEISKIISFSFRLFGNIFAGSVMLFVIGTLAAALQSVFLLFEVFVGLIQALIFGMLTMVFMAMATHGHGDHMEGEHA